MTRPAVDQPPREVGGGAAAEHGCYRRSPFLLLRWDDDRVVLTDCQHARDYRCPEGVVALLTQLSRWRTRAQLAQLGTPTSRATLDRLVDRNLVQVWLEGEREPPNDLRCWDLFDLAVQRRSNTGGANPERAAQLGPPPAAFKPRVDGRRTLPPPPSPLRCELDAALSSRRSIRRFAPEPMRLAELSDVLHHSARVLDITPVPGLGDGVRRPFAQAGARSELELYILANAVDGLAPGAHYYDARDHQFVQLRGHDRCQSELNSHLSWATGLACETEPPAAIILTAVFERLMWKYERLGLSLVYKDVGCLTQTLYLVATALGLAPCAVGALPELKTAGWLGLDPLHESVVGCMLLGRVAQSQVGGSVPVRANDPI